MRESIAAFHLQTQLVDEGEIHLVVKQKLLDFRTKGRVFLALKEESEAKVVGFFKADECLRTTPQQGEAN